MNNTPEDIKEIEERLKKINKNDTNEKDNKNAGVSKSARIGLRIITEFVSAIFLGGAMGYFLDIMLDTKPFLLAILLLCGASAGFLNIYRFVKNNETEEI